MADNTPTHNEDSELIVKFKTNLTSPWAELQSKIKAIGQNLTMPDLPSSTMVDTSALEQWAEDAAQYQLQKERQENRRFWLNFWLSVTALIVAVLSLLMSLI